MGADDALRRGPYHPVSFKTETTEQLPSAFAVMDPFHVVRLAGDALNDCRCRVHNSLHGWRGRKNDPSYRARQTLHTGVDLLTDKLHQRIAELFANHDMSKSRRPGVSTSDWSPPTATKTDNAARQPWPLSST